MTRGNLQIIAAVLLVGSIFLNIWGYQRLVSFGPPRNSDELVMAEEEYQHVRQRLLDANSLLLLGGMRSWAVELVFRCLLTTLTLDGQLISDL